MTVDGIGGFTDTLGSRRGAADNPARIREGAAQFEALLVAQMLRSARESGDGGLMGAGESQTDSTMLEMAEGCFAEMLSSRGGLGLREMIEQHLCPKDSLKNVQPASDKAG